MQARATLSLATGFTLSSLMWLWAGVHAQPFKHLRVFDGDAEDEAEM